jgi:hypothetical protein
MIFPDDVVIVCWAVLSMLDVARNGKPIANVPIAATTKKKDIRVPRILYA